MNHSIKSILSNSILIVGLAGVYADSPNARSLNNNQVIIDWNETAFNTAVASDGYANLFYHDRARTMMHIAQHDAINAIVRKYDSYLPTERIPGANPTVAAAQAAHDVLVAAYPAQTEALDARLAEWFSGTSLNEQRMSGITVGQRAAAAIIADREGDGFDFWGTYIPGNSPGDYQYVPPFDGFVFQPGLQDARPFSLASADQLRSPDRPALTSEQYAEDYNEVKTIGSASSTVRTAEQTAYATFWYELSDITWNTIARVTAAEQKLDLWRTARLFALINIVTTDGYVAGWESKFYYDFWRPYTAIRGGDTDGNDFTAADTSWESFLINPPIPDYPSTHSVLGMAAARVLVDVFGTDDVTFSLVTSSAVPTGTSRTYSSFTAAALENAESRIAGGIHFRFSTEAGLTMGAEIAEHAINNYLLKSSGN